MITIYRTQRDVDALAALGRQPDPRPDPESYGVMEKPWGFEHELYRSTELSAWLLNVKPEAETSMHCHPGKATVLVVQAGEVVLTTLTESFALRVGDSVLIEKGAFHRTTARRDGAALIEYETPPHKRDLVRLTDRYGRQEQGYEQCA